MGFLKMLVWNDVISFVFIKFENYYNIQDIMNVKFKIFLHIDKTNSYKRELSVLL